MHRVDGVRAVTYDCWGTLLQDRDWQGAMQIRVSALLRFIDASEEEARTLLDRAWAKHDEAWKQVDTFGPGRMAAYCLEEHGIFDTDAINQLSREFEEASLQTGVECVDGALDTIKKLRGSGIRLGLVCDTGLTPGRVVRQLLDDCGVAEHLEAFCFSDEVGVPKPGPEIFGKALAELGIEHPPEAVHVGDLKRTDIEGALSMGMHAVRFRGVHDDAAEGRDAKIVIDRHEQLLEILGLD